MFRVIRSAIWDAATILIFVWMAWGEPSGAQQLSAILKYQYNLTQHKPEAQAQAVVKHQYNLPQNQQKSNYNRYFKELTEG